MPSFLAFIVIGPRARLSRKQTLHRVHAFACSAHIYPTANSSGQVTNVNGTLAYGKGRHHDFLFVLIKNV